MKISMLRDKDKKIKIDIPDHFLGEPIEGALEKFKEEQTEKSNLQTRKNLSIDIAKKFGVENGIREPVLTGVHEALLIGAGSRIYAWDCKANQLYSVAERNNYVFGFAQINDELFDVGGINPRGYHAGRYRSEDNGKICKTLTGEEILEADHDIMSLIAFNGKLYHATDSSVRDTLEDKFVEGERALINFNGNLLSFRNSKGFQQYEIFNVFDDKAKPVANFPNTPKSLTQIGDTLYYAAGRSIRAAPKSKFDEPKSVVVMSSGSEHFVYSLANFNNELYYGTGIGPKGAGSIRRIVEKKLSDTYTVPGNERVKTLDRPVYALFSLEKPMWDKVRDKARKV